MVGNILTANGHTYSYTNADWKDLLTAYDGETITYDAIGNPLSYYNGTRWTFTWEDGRQLATATDGTTNVSYTYDSDGIRTSKTVDGVKHTYVYASGKLLRETYGSNTLDFFYSTSGQPYALKHNGTIYYYITNLQGDVMQIVNGDGAAVASYEYDPYGNIISATGELAEINPLRYRGYVYDQECNLYYLQSRYYDPGMGRFLNADALVSTGQGILGYNMFTYCGNNPVMGYDPSGLINWGGVFAGLVIAVVAVAAIAATVATAGAASPLVAAAGTAVGTAVSTALVEAAVVTTVGAVKEDPVVYDVTVTNGHHKVGYSVVYDFGEDTAEAYIHDGAQSNDEYGVTVGSGFVYNYNNLGDYGGEFYDVSVSGKFKGANIGIDGCTDPKNIYRTGRGSGAVLFTSGLSVSPNGRSRSINYSYDYYWQVATN